MLGTDEKTYLIGDDLSPKQTVEMIRAGVMFRTSMPPIGMIEELFLSLKEEGYDAILALPICSGLSGCLGAMITAAQAVEIELEYVDCYSTAAVQLYLTLCGRKLLDQGRELAEVRDILQKTAEDSVTFVIPQDLFHLAKGGRLTRKAAAFASLLKINPILIINKESGGSVDSYENTRTLKRAEARIVDYFREHGVNEDYRICVAHVDDPVEGEKFFALLKESFPLTPSYMTDLVPVISVHTGIGTIACQYMRRIKEAE